MKIGPNACRAGREQEAKSMRSLCSVLHFWKYCGHKKCLRARACAVDHKDCFDRFWPHVPEEVKIMIRTGIKSKAAGLSPQQTLAAVERETERWRATMAQCEAAEV
jgi:hypothetical protein